MVVAHLGIAVSLAGMASNAAFTTERLAVVQLGETVKVGPWLVQLEDVTPTAGQNWTAIEAQLRATRGSGPLFLHPQTRYFTDPVTETNEAAIDTFWNGQLYTVLGKADPSGGWQVRLWWKPFVTLIWAGGFLIAFGGALAVGGRLWRMRRRGASSDWRRERYA
jgi:cytochrome c-type biogenesis protein CcmF